MLGGHLPELMIVLVLALVVFGPKRLPEIGSSLGAGIRDFKKSVTGLHEDLPAPVAHEAETVVPVVTTEPTH